MSNSTSACHARQWLTTSTVCLTRTGAQSGGGWHHPLHIHLSDYLVLAGKGRDSDAYVDWDILTQVGAGNELTADYNDQRLPCTGLRPHLPSCRLLIVYTSQQSRGPFKSLNPLACGPNTDCEEGFVCGSTNSCVKQDGCVDDRDCPWGTYCDPTQSQCVENQVRIWEQDAPKGETSDPAHTCEPMVSTGLSCPSVIFADLSNLGNGHDLWLLMR